MEELLRLDSTDAVEAVHVELRRAREERRLTIDALARASGVRPAILAALDAGDYAALPSGLYGRHAVRAYARAVGLEPEAAVAAASPLLPAMDDPIAAMARVRGLTPARSEPPRTRRSDQKGDRRPGPWSNPRVLNEWRGAPPAATAEQAAARRLWPGLAASLVDALLFAAFAIVLAWLTAWASGAPLEQVAPIAAPAWALLVVVLSAMYVGLLGGVCHETLGTRVIRTVARRASGQMSVVDVGEADSVELRDRLCF